MTLWWIGRLSGLLNIPSQIVKGISIGVTNHPSDNLGGGREEEEGAAALGVEPSGGVALYTLMPIDSWVCSIVCLLLFMNVKDFD